jgi:excisionase family DNA binding protein
MINFEEKRVRLYKMREASNTLGVHPNTIRRWERQGKIKTVRVGKGHRKVPESEINRILQHTPSIPPISPRIAPSQEGGLAAFLNFVFSYHRDDPDLVKKAIIVRDNYTCQNCGSKEMLDAHHMEGTSRDDPNNFITLCQGCLAKMLQQANLHGEKPVIYTPNAEKQQILTEKAEIKSEQADFPTITEVHRHAILNALKPAGLAYRTAFVDLLSAAMVLKKFTAKELAGKSKCPEQTAQVFCGKMAELEYITDTEGKFELAVVVLG